MGANENWYYLLPVHGRLWNYCYRARHQIGRTRSRHSFYYFKYSFRIRKPLPNITFHQVEVNQYAVFQYPPYDITLSTKISDVIQEYDLDILHMHYAVPHAVCGILAKQMSGKDVKIMTTLHGTDITVLGYDHSLKNAIKFGIEESDIVTSVSRSLAQQTYEIIDTDKEIVPIYNFVRENEFPTCHNEELKRKLWYRT